MQRPAAGRGNAFLIAVHAAVVEIAGFTSFAPTTRAVGLDLGPEISVLPCAGNTLKLRRTKQRITAADGQHHRCCEDHGKQ